MDWTRAYEQVMSGSPVYIGAALLAVAWVTRKSVLATVARFGERLERLQKRVIVAEQQAYLERVRRWQLEVVLMEEGVRFPAWPDLETRVPSPLTLHPLAERSSLP